MTGMTDETCDSAQMGELAAALAAAQAELRDPNRNKNGQVRGRRDYKYAGLDDLLQTVRPVLSKHGLAVTQTVEVLDGRVVLSSRLLHQGGGVISSRYPLEWTGGPQERGAELTYARRYSLEAIVGVSATDDDDASSVTNAYTEQAEAKAAPRGPAPAVLDAFERSDWNRNTVVADVRDFFRWLGKTVDPWSLTPEQQSKLPRIVADQQAELEAWIGWRGEIAQLLMSRQLKIEHLSGWCRSISRPVPEEMDRARREKLLTFLRDGGGIDQIARYASNAA